MGELLHDVFIVHLAEWIGLIGLVFGAGVAWQRLMKSQAELGRVNESLAECTRELRDEMGNIKLTVQKIIDRKDLFMQKAECRSEQSSCQSGLMRKLDDIWRWLDEDRKRGHGNEKEIAKLAEKIDAMNTLLRNGSSYGRNSG